MLAGKGLVKRFDESAVLNSVDISVNPGRITVLIGPSGGGKTTLLRTLALLDKPDAGEIVVDNISYDFASSAKSQPAPPWPKVTVVFQQLFLWPHLTLRENILLPLRLRSPGQAEVSRELIELLGLESFIDRYPNRVSIGQRQRAALARAVTLQPAYILLDEITSALDVEQTSVIMEFLLALRDRGIGLLVVTHLLGFARRLLSRGEGDHVAFLDHGRLLESGDVDVLDNPKHDRLRQFLSAIAPVM